MRAFFLLFFSLVTLTVSAQIYNPVKWTITLTPAGDGNYTFLAKATIDEGWWVYSQYLENEDGPIATTVNFDNGDHFKLVGKNKESDNAKKIFDKVFEMEVVKFQKYYTIEQKIKVTDPSKPITGYVNFMTCNDERCLPPTDKEFELKATGGSTGAAGTKAATEKTSPAPNQKSDASKGTEVASAEKKKTSEETPTIELKGTSAFSNASNTTGNSTAGILKPVRWTFRSEKSGDGLYNVIAEATIEDGWHIYGPGQTKEDGPVPTSFILKPDVNHSIEGNLEESSTNRIEGHDKYFDMEVVKFKHDLRLTRKIKSSNPSRLSGSLEFIACNEVKCLSPEYIDFEIDLTTGQEVKETAEKIGPRIDDQGLIDQRIESLKTTYAEPVSDCGEKTEEEKGNLLWMFIFGMINGFVALLTPCVFPMIPLTVSFFTKDTKRKGWENGLWYGISIMAIYVILGLIITILFGAGSLNELSTNPIANTIFFLIFVVFAFSFFGFYEITLPSSWSNKSDAMADKGGMIGIFFMAATLAIVSFSCTGPLIGTALVEASSEGFLGPLVVMGGFALALAIPFSLFAAFPAWLNSLPKSGGWMNSVKVILGFAELALAFKFLSIADMTAHWGILKYELFMGLWVIIALGMAAYMFGVIRFPHDSPNRRLSPLGALMGLIFAGVGLYLATGLFGSEKTGTYNSLSLMSGLAPPAHYNFFKPLGEVRQDEIEGQYASLSKCANNFNCFHDYYEGLSYARETKKPVLLDFTGYGCVNCRKTEEHIWSQEKIRKKINDEFVLISLYVDDKITIDTPQLRSAVTNERIRTIGQKWTDFQIVNFGQNSQPLYVILSPDEQVLTAPRGYDPDAEAYEDFLQCGLNTFKEMNAPVLGSND
jgi:thiol:disulfide interchange protein DsbD